MPRLSALIPLALAATFLSCASAGGPGATGSTSERISSSEMANAGVANAYDAIVRLRPNWLRTHGVSSVGGGSIRGMTVPAYLDGHRLPDFESLRMLPANGLASIEWIEATRAAAIFNDLNSEPIAGAISIKSK